MYLLSFWREILLVLLSITILIFNNYNNRLKDEIAYINQSMSVCKYNNEHLVSSIDKQNKYIGILELDLTLKTKEYNKWKELPTKIKYVHIPSAIRETKSNDCNDTKNSIGYVRNIDYSLL